MASPAFFVRTCENSGSADRPNEISPRLVTISRRLGRYDLIPCIMHGRRFAAVCANIMKYSPTKSYFRAGQYGARARQLPGAGILPEYKNNCGFRNQRIPKYLLVFVSDHSRSFQVETLMLNRASSSTKATIYSASRLGHHNLSINCKALSI